MADKPKWGAGHAGRMLAKGLDELRAVSFWEGSNAAQPLHAPHEKSGFERAIEASRADAAPERDGPERGRDRSGGHER